MMSGLPHPARCDPGAQPGAKRDVTRLRLGLTEQVRWVKACAAGNIVHPIAGVKRPSRGGWEPADGDALDGNVNGTKVSVESLIEEAEYMPGISASCSGSRRLPFSTTKCGPGRLDGQRAPLFRSRRGRASPPVPTRVPHPASFGTGCSRWSQRGCESRSRLCLPSMSLPRTPHKPPRSCHL